MRLAFAKARIEPDLFKELIRPRANIAFRNDPMNPKGLFYDLSHRLPRIQRGVRILKDHLYVSGPLASFRRR